MERTNITIGREIGSGAFGSVYEGFDNRLQRRVAVKIIRASAELVSNAMAHARALARVNHPNIVNVYSLETVHDPQTSQPREAIIMELVEGPTLRDLLKSRTLTKAEILEIGHGLIDAVAHMHHHGITHEDLHEENVLIAGTSAKIIDIFYRTTLSSLSTAPRETRTRRDIANLKDILAQIVAQSELGPQASDAFFVSTSRVLSLDALRRSLHTLSVPASAHPEASPNDPKADETEGEYPIVEKKIGTPWSSMANIDAEVQLVRFNGKLLGSYQTEDMNGPTFYSLYKLRSGRYLVYTEHNHRGDYCVTHLIGADPWGEDDTSPLTLSQVQERIPALATAAGVPRVHIVRS